MIVNTTRLYDYIRVVRYALISGRKWHSGSKKIMEDYWNKYRSDTCVNICEDGIVYYNRDYYIREGITIIPMEEFSTNVLLDGFR